MSTETFFEKKKSWWSANFWNISVLSSAKFAVRRPKLKPLSIEPIPSLLPIVRFISRSCFFTQCVHVSGGLPCGLGRFRNDSSNANFAALFYVSHTASPNHLNLCNGSNMYSIAGRNCPSHDVHAMNVFFYLTYVCKCYWVKVLIYYLYEGDPTECFVLHVGNCLQLCFQPSRSFFSSYNVANESLCSRQCDVIIIYSFQK